MSEQERNFTSIQVSKETRDRLKEMGLTDNESYESILVRLLDGKMGGREVEYLLQDINGDCNLKAVVDWGVADKNQCVRFYDKNGNCTENVPNYQFDDKDFQDKWDRFTDMIMALDNIVNILAILESGESIRAGDIVLSRF